MVAHDGIAPAEFEVLNGLAAIIKTELLVSHIRTLAASNM